MARGIRPVLIEKLGLDNEEDRRCLRIILRQRVARLSYQQALMAPGAQRHGLDGVAVEPVEPSHQRAAAKAAAKLQGKTP